MIEKVFQNRVPAYPGRVRLTHVNGDLYQMERADNPTVQGTPLNKAYFDSIVQSRLTGRFYDPTIKKTQVTAHTGVSANPIPTVWEKETSGRAVSGLWAISSSINDDSEVYMAVDGKKTTRWISAAGTTAELILDTGSVLAVKKMRLHTAAINGTYTSLEISGSNDGITWTTLETLESVPNENTEITLSNSGAFKLYRLSFVLSYSNVNASVWEWAFSEYDFSTYANLFTVESGVPAEWTAGQRLMLQTPENTNTLGVVSNSVNGISCSTILQPGKRYELRYTGTAFAAKEV